MCVMLAAGASVSPWGTQVDGGSIRVSLMVQAGKECVENDTGTN